MIETAFANDGPLAVLSGYHERPDQIALACAVERALISRKHLVAEAPTGVGKSFAYLIPATQRATRNDDEGGRTLVVTPTKSLQDQLVDKDLPTLQRILPWHFRFALLKGRSNYVCLERAHNVEFNDKLDANDRAEARRALLMLKQEESGEIDRLGVDLSVPARMAITCSSDDCTFSKCPHYKLDSGEPCYVSRARARAAEADIVVANYHLLFWDVRLGGLVLPDFDSIIFDEAHELPKVARGFFDDLISPRAVRRCATGLKHDGKDTLRLLMSNCNAFFDEVDTFVGDSRTPLRVRKGIPCNWEPLRDSLQDVVDYYSRKLDRNPEDAKSEKRREQTMATRDRLFDLVTSGDPNRVYWIDRSRRDEMSLNSRVIDVSGYLREQVFERWPSVLTSATLSVGGRIDHFARETGVPEPEFLEVGSPFNWKRQARFVIDGEAPDPSKERDAFDEHVEDRFVEIVRIMGGRTLGLLTSRRMLDRVHARLVSEQLDCAILKQGSGSLARIVDEFKRDTESVLLGVQSLWQGIDAPGETCSCVVIDKLPFPMPGDPLLDALKDKLGRDYFFEEVIPRMVIPLKQGFGRAVRRVDDRCVIVLLDPRPLVKSYGRTLFASLPPVPRARSLAVLDDFFNRPEGEL